jgi:hypothetical protein
VLKQKIWRGGLRQIIEASQWELVEIADGLCVFFVSEPPMHHDSAIVVQADGQMPLTLAMATYRSASVARTASCPWRRGHSAQSGAS